MSKSDNQAPATKQDILDIVSIVMAAIGRLEERIDGIEDTMATKDDLENLKHQLLLSDEQTRRDIADMYQDQLSLHDDRITKLEGSLV